MLTEGEAHRLVQIIKESVGLPRGAWLDRLEKEIPRANAANIRMALSAQLELAKWNMEDAEAKESAVRNLLHALLRAEALSGIADMTVADAEVYLRDLARGGNVEAQKLILAFDDPFAD